MKRFLLKLTIYLLIVLSVLFYFNHRWVSSQVYQVAGESYRMKEVPYDIEICNIGSSHTQFAIDYDEFELAKGFNFAVPAQSFMYGLNMLKQYEKHLAKDCIVVIPISYFDYYEDYEKESIKIRERRFYYPILKLSLIEELDIIDVIKYKWLPITTIKDDQLKYVFKDDTSAINNYEAQYNYNKHKSTNNIIDLDAFLGENDIKVYGHSKDFDKGVNDYSVDKLREIIEFCLEGGFTPILITTPFTSYYNDADDFQHGFYDEFYELTYAISDEYSLDYWDYSHDSRFIDDLTLFYDNNHLNKGKGMALFTSIFIKRLDDEGYIN